MVSILDLFKPEELTETNNGYKTTCCDCGKQGGRTEGFILFPETNTSFCHSSGKWFNMLQTAGLKLKIIKCIEGNDKGERPEVEEDLKKEIYDAIEEEYGSDFLIEFKISLGDIDDFLIPEYTAKGLLKGYKVNIDSVADYMIDKYDIKTVSGKKEETLYLYENGIWTSKGRGIIKSYVENLLSYYCKINVVNEIIEKIKRKTDTPREEFEEVPEYKKCFENGVLDIEDINNIKFLPHSKDYNFKRKFPIKYNPEANCSQILKFIEDTFYPEDVLQVQEWFGFHLSSRYLFKKAVIAHGPKNTGKSVFLNLLTTFLGKSNVADLSLQKISIGKGFDLLELKNKEGNIHDDLSSKDLNDGGGFKMAVGDGYISGEEKFGEHLKFRNTAKHTFSCNRIPPVKDVDDDAYYDRWLIWALDNVVEIKDRDIDLIKKITTTEELSGLLNWALEGYYRLIKQNGFSNEKESDEIKGMMIRNSSPLARFVDECLTKENGSKISKEDLYKKYCEFCESDTPISSPCSKEQLGRQLTRYAPYAQASSDGTKRYWLNVKFMCESDTYYTSKKLMSNYRKEGNNDIKIIDIKFPKVSYPSEEKNSKKNMSLKNKTQNKKPKTDREVQFYEAKECENIKSNCTKEEVYQFLKDNPGDYKQLYEKFGIGCLKFYAEWKKENGIKC